MTTWTWIITVYLTASVILEVSLFYLTLRNTNSKSYAWHTIGLFALGNGLVGAALVGGL